MSITDNGVGWHPDSASAGHGLGNMRERASMMGATLHLSSKPGIGTTVLLDVAANSRWHRS